MCLLVGALRPFLRVADYEAICEDPPRVASGYCAIQSTDQDYLLTAPLGSLRTTDFTTIRSWSPASSDSKA